MEQENKPRLTIITVVFNSEKYIDKTIESVVSQDYDNIEYIIIDGGSTDKTTDIINTYIEHIDTYISEPDEGLYDAMNKAIDYVHGDYVLFLNSGDKMYKSNTITGLFNQCQNHPDIIYGDTMLINAEGRETKLRRLRPPEKLSWKSLQMGMLVCHQSFIVSKEKLLKYNLYHRFSADFDWMIRTLKASENICNSKMIISAFLEGGKTSKTILPGLLERFRIMTSHYGLILTLFNHLRIMLRFFGRRF